MGSWGSTVPAALTGLVSTFQTHIIDVHVAKLSVVGNSSRTEVIAVGYESGTSAAVEANPDMGDYGLRSQREQYTVNCRVDVVRGGTDPDPAVARVFEIFNKVGEALDADPKLGTAAVMSARLGPWQFALHQTAKGCLAVVAFAVEVDAFTTPR